MYNLKSALLCSLAALTLNTPALSLESSAGTQSYEPAYFEQYAPRTALDMVGRIPGFQLSRGNQKRGLGNGGANLLINGARITGKSNAREQLSAITATNVVKIEIVDGASLGIPGLSGQVADVTTNTTGISGTWTWSPEFRKRLSANIFPASVTVSGQTGTLAYSVSLKSRSNRNGHAGPETHTLADGTLYEIRDEDAQYYGDSPGISTSLSWKPQDGHVGNLNLEYNQTNFNIRETSKRRAITDLGTTQESLFTRAEDEVNGSASADYEFPAGPGKLKLTGYYRYEHSPTVSRFDLFDPALGHTDGSRFFRVADEAETIGRMEYSLNRGEGEDWQLGIEGAFNYLDIASELLVLDNAGAFVNEPLDGASARVEEKRAEVTLTHSHKFSEKWDLQVSAGAEYSQISQTGATGQVRDFIRPKGFITTTYKPNSSLSLRAKLEREVGQLSFFDFISSVSLEDNFDTAGNANIVPQQAWIGQLELDKDFGKGSTFKVSVFGERISDLVDRIPIGIDGDAIGNIDSAVQYGVEFSSTINGERWGYKGVEFKLSLELQNSSVDDPLLGFSRRLNNDLISSFNMRLRHDIPNTNWAYGGFIDQRVNARAYRLQTIGQRNQITPFTGVFVEHKDIFGMKVRAIVLNLLGSTDEATRKIYTDRRDIGVLETTEFQVRDFGLIGRLRISGTF